MKVPYTLRPNYKQTNKKESHEIFTKGSRRPDLVRVPLWTSPEVVE